MSRGQGSDSAEFGRVLTALAVDSCGWRGSAGTEFVELMHRVFERKIGALKSNSHDRALLVDASDAVSEAVLVVEGPSRLSLSQNIRRILAMEKPLGYVVAAVSANLSRAELAGQMGTGSRHVAAGAPRVLHFGELTSTSERDPLDKLEADPAWSRGQCEGSGEARAMVSSFIAVLAQRFQVQPEISRRGLEVAGSTALMGDTGVGLTPSTSRRRVGSFLKALPELRGSFDRVQGGFKRWAQGTLRASLMVSDSPASCGGVR